MIGSRILKSVLFAAALSAAAVAQPMDVQLDARIAPAIAAAMQADEAGAQPEDALKPVLALPQFGCWMAKVGDTTKCEQEYGPYFVRPPLRGEALRVLVEAYFAEGPEPKPSLDLTKATLKLMAKNKGSRFDVAKTFARLNDRKEASAALKASGLGGDHQRMYLGLWFNDLDAAAEAALRIASPSRAFGTLPRANRAAVRQQVIEAARAAGRTDLETKLLQAEANDY
jgi:hypothetical protein